MDRRVFLQRGMSGLVLKRLTPIAVASAAISPRLHASFTYSEYARYDGLGLAELVRRGEVTPQELLDQAVARADAVNPKINAIVRIFADHARQSIKDGLPDGPFRGVPFLVKDMSFAIKGIPSSAGSRLFDGRVSSADSTAVSRLRKSGLVLFATTSVPELGILPTTESAQSGITRNPFQRTKTAGGSSGGSAAAVAAGIAPMASASDGGGSIRIPASCCGLFGLKPTRSRVPIGPGYFEAWAGLATLHAITRSVRDSAALLDVSAGPAPGDSYHSARHEGSYLAEVSKPPAQLRVALVKTMPPAEWVDPENEKALAKTTQLLAELGHRVEDCTDAFSRSFEFNRLRNAHGIAVLVSVRRRILGRLRELGRELRDDDVEPVTRFYHDVASRYTAVEMEDARAAFHHAARDMAQFLSKYDVVMTPTLGTPPIDHGEITMTGMAEDVRLGILKFLPCTQMANWTGQPAMSVPLHMSPDGLPMGIHFMGRFGDEATLLRLAGQLEVARPWKDQRPSLTV